MIITLKRGAPKAGVEELTHTFENKGLFITTIQRDNYNVSGLVDDTSKIDEKLVGTYSFVENVTCIIAPYKKANRLFHPADTIVGVAGTKVDGNEKIVVIGGPCSAESDTQIMDIAKEVRNTGGNMLHGGAHKPRTSPYAFQGIGTEGAKCVVHVRETYGLPIVGELMSAGKIDELVGHVDLIRIGAGNMQNFNLSKAVGRINEPVLLKRRLTNTTEEWTMTAEYIISKSNENAIFCERGTRTSETYTRNTLDLSVVSIIKERTHLSIIIDPSHVTSNWRLVESTSLVAIAAGTDGPIIKMHNGPEDTWSDDAQSLGPGHFGEVIRKRRKIAEVIGRSM